MNELENEEVLYLGLTGGELDFESIDLGRGVVLRRTYAHLMAPYLMAFAPAPTGEPHPGPWKAAGGGGGFDITAELTLPVLAEFAPISNLSVGKVLVALMRLWASPSLSAPVVATVPFASVAGTPDQQAQFTPLEVGTRHFPLQTAEGKALTAAQFDWLRDHWEKSLGLLKKHSEVRLALDVIDRAQFVANRALILVSLWGALEALFSPGKTELRFRVSANIASYLEPSGNARHALHKKAMSLYDARSAAAHGASKEDTVAILGSFELLRRVLLKMFSEDYMPTKEELERTLFGAGPVQASPQA